MIARAAGVGVARTGIRHLHAGRMFEPLLRLRPDLGAAVERPAVRPAELVERRRLERRRAEIHRLDDVRIGRPHVLELVVDAGADVADEIQIRRASSHSAGNRIQSGFGESCLTGSKALCCPLLGSVAIP